VEEVSNLEPFGAIWSHLEPFEAIWSQTWSQTVKAPTWWLIFNQLKTVKQLTFVFLVAAKAIMNATGRYYS